MKQEKIFDVIIVGGSYAGLAAGMALGRALRKVLIIDNGHPCNKQTPYAHNFLTNDGKTPGEISGMAKKQVLMYPHVTFYEGSVVTASKEENHFSIRVHTGEVFTSRKLVLATGIKDTMPDIPGFAESWGISVLHCPYCHGYEVRQQKTGILANGDAAFELSALISNWTTDLTIYTNGKTTLTDQQLAKLVKHGIAVVEDKIHCLENEKGYIQHIVFSDGAKTPVKALYARLPFIQGSSLPHDLGCEMNEQGYISVDAEQKTTVYGVYACGDNASRMRTVANAVAMGTSAGMMVNRELIEEHF